MDTESDCKGGCDVRQERKSKGPTTGNVSCSVGDPIGNDSTNGDTDGFKEEKGASGVWRGDF